MRRSAMVAMMAMPIGHEAQGVSGAMAREVQTGAGSFESDVQVVVHGGYPFGLFPSRRIRRYPPSPSRSQRLMRAIVRELSPVCSSICR